MHKIYYCVRKGTELESRKFLYALAWDPDRDNKFKLSIKYPEPDDMRMRLLPCGPFGPHYCVTIVHRHTGIPDAAELAGPMVNGHG